MKMVAARLFCTFIVLVGFSGAQEQMLACPKVTSKNYDTKLIGRDSVRPFTEVSGLVFSKTQVVPSTGDPIIYAITDGRNNNGAAGRGRVGVFNSITGRRLVTLVLSNATGENWDWETMTLGTCGPHFSPQDNCIYVGDVGDNVAIATNGRRNDRKDTWPYRIIKIREPNLTKAAEDASIDVLDIPDSDVVILPFDYSDPSSPKRFADCESIFLDHTGWGDGNSIGDIYVVPKWGDSNLFQNRLFKIGVEAWDHAVRGVGVNPWIGDAVLGLTPEVVVEKNLRKRQSTTSFSVNIPQTTVNASDPSNEDTTTTNANPPQETPTTSNKPSGSSGAFHSTGGISVNLSPKPSNKPEALSHPIGGVLFLPQYTPEVVGDYTDSSEFNKFKWTGADMTLDGMVMSLSTPEAAAFFLRCPGESVAAALTGSSLPCLVLPKLNPEQRSGMETSAWTPDGKEYLQIPEGRRPRMAWADMDRSDVGGVGSKRCHRHPHFDNFLW